VLAKFPDLKIGMHTSLELQDANRYRISDLMSVVIGLELKRSQKRVVLLEADNENLKAAQIIRDEKIRGKIPILLGKIVRKNSARDSKTNSLDLNGVTIHLIQWEEKGNCSRILRTFFSRKRPSEKRKWTSLRLAGL